jgi:hypothetical protein
VGHGKDDKHTHTILVRENWMWMGPGPQPDHAASTVGVFYTYIMLYYKYAVCIHYVPIPEAARSKAWVCGRSFAGIVGSNPCGGIDVCLL